MNQKIILNVEEVSETLSLSISQIQKMASEGNFPPPRRLSPMRVGWLRREIEVWAEARPVSDIPPPPNTEVAPRNRAVG